ncbi:MAG: dTDP-4-dehydrorhamnose reductase [Deltaproteobacteria bacterium]|nr:MAG: dTDP-4-dehydrorhamnose reductase [Deltaproteobacteria bacterium]
MKILLLGSSGMLGSDCKEVLSEDYEVIAPDKNELNIISWDVVIENIQRIGPDVVLNCAGFTDVDACETEDFMVRKVNLEGPRNLAQGSARFNCKLIHISSDYVFSGKKSVPQPYFEDDPGEPISAYGKSKMESEIAVRENAPNYIIVRSGWLYGINGENFIKSILINALQKNKNKKRKILKVVNDQFGSPTWTYRLALQIKDLIKSDAKGTYHATSEGYCTRFEYAQHVLKKLKVKVSLEPCRMNDFPQAAKRPTNCILENRLLKKQGINIMPNWKKDVNTFLDQFGQDLIKQAKAKKR